MRLYLFLAVLLAALICARAQPKSRQKRYLLLWCMNFPDCCDLRGKDMCGFACPKCPIKLDKYGNRLTTTPKPKPPTSPAPADLAVLVGQRGENSLQESDIPADIPADIRVLLQNPQIQEMILSMVAARGGPTPDLSALLKVPFIRDMIVSRLMARLSSTSSSNTPSSPAPPRSTTPRSTTTTQRTTTPAPKSAALEAIPGFAELAEAFPGGPAKLQEVLNDPQVLDFITSNPDIVQSVLGDGPPSPEKLQALLTLAAPPPEGVQQGVFGPDIFAGEELDVQGFPDDYEYDDYEDYEDEYGDYGNFEGDSNDIDIRDGRSFDGRSKDEQKARSTTTEASTTSTEKTSTETPKLRFGYRLLSSSQGK